MNRADLERPFPPELLRHRPGRNGPLAYVPGTEIVGRLNAALDGEWSFTILQHDILEEEVVVLGRLTAEGISKEAFGSSSITRSRDGSKVVSVGDDLKSAATDSLKKAATLLGVALRTSSASGTTTSPPAAERRKPALVRDGNAASGGGSENASLTRSQLGAVRAIARRLDWSDDALAEWLLAGTGFADPKLLDKRGASKVIDLLQEELRAAETAAC